MGLIRNLGTRQKTLSTSFTRPTTFGRRHHSHRYSILCASLQGLHPNVIFPQDSQVGIPKLKLLLSLNFGHSYLFQIKFFFRMQGKYLIALKKIFPTVYNTPPIGYHLTHVFKGFVTPSFDYNSCK